MRLEGFLIKLCLLIVTYFVRHGNRPYKSILILAGKSKF